MTGSEWITLGGVATVLAFLWRINERISGLEARINERISGLEVRIGKLGERIAKIEGLLEGLRDIVTGRQPTSE